MKQILIVGAGQVGQSLAAALSRDGQDVTIVDVQRAHLDMLESHLDIRTIQGSGAHPGILEAAGARTADLLIAVTASDEINMMSCQIGATLFGIPTKIARVRERSYLDHQQVLFSPQAIPVDLVIAPEAILTQQIQQLIEHPGALQVLDFADGLVSLVGVRAYFGGALVGHELRNLQRDMPSIEARVAAIFRRNRPIEPLGRTVIEADDEVFFVAAKKDILAVTAELRALEAPYRRILIGGGGNVGRRLAECLAHDYRVAIIERHAERADWLRQVLPESVEVLVGDSTDDRCLSRTGIHATDVFCAVTNDDQANIFSGMMAKRCGVRKVIALIHRVAYVNLLQGSAIDIVISPQQATLGVLLARIRGGSMAIVHSLRRGAAEAIEIVLGEALDYPKVVHQRIDALPLPQGASIGAIVREQHVIMPHHDTELLPWDHIILFVAERGHLPAVQKLFQPRQPWWEALESMPWKRALHSTHTRNTG
jgi:trk system potassium uptake protein TrkA